jgi:hypothetical protein
MTVGGGMTVTGGFTGSMMAGGLGAVWQPIKVSNNSKLKAIFELEIGCVIDSF